MTLIQKKQLLLALTALVICTLFFVPPIPQALSYHTFADVRLICLLPNFWNVISNIPFLIIGALGIYYCVYKLNNNQMRIVNTLFFVGIFLTGIGSSYYHYNPNNGSLLWDRLPMTIAFMAFFSIIIAEFINKTLAHKLIIPLLLFGMLSLLYWQYTENQNCGDLRMYVLVQFLPMILIPIILILFKNTSNVHINYLWYVIAAYAIAKLFEALDYPIFSLGNIISGHSLKHVAASIAPCIYLIRIKKLTNISSI
jgi:hypothetical protein